MTGTQIQITPANELYLAWMKHYDFLANGLHRVASVVCDKLRSGSTHYTEAMTELCINVFLAKCVAKGGASSHDREVCETILKCRSYLPSFNELIRQGYRESRQYGGQRVPRELLNANNEVDQIWIDEARKVCPRIEQIFSICARVIEVSIARDPKPVRNSVLSGVYILYYNASQIHGLTGNSEAELDCIGHIGKELYADMQDTHRRQFPGVYS